MASPHSDETRLAEELAAYDEALREAREAGNASEDSDLRRLLNRLEERYPRHRLAETRDDRAGAPPGSSVSPESEPGPKSFDIGTGITQRLGRFEIMRELGRGGFGVVFQAYDARLQRQVALKVPRADTLATAEIRERFLHEAKAAAGLDHPNIVPIYEVGEVGPVCYIALAYCEGQNLAQWLHGCEKPVAPQEAAAIVAALADGVQHGHDRGILHRDLKPANIMLVPVPKKATELSESPPFTPRLTDFGMAKLVDGNLTQTHSSIIMGTPLYMSPEQAEGRSERIGPTTDVYSLGAILYELLTGQTPFDADSVLIMLDRLRSNEPPAAPRTLQSSIPSDLETICLKCLRKEPSRRYASAADLAADLRRFLRGEPVEARNPTWVERFGNWVQQRQRIRDAGVLMIWLNAIVAAWTILNFPIIHLAGLFTEARISSSVVAQDTVLVASIHIFAVWLGRAMTRERRYAIWLGTAVSLLLLTVAFVVATGVVESFGGGMYSDPLTRTLVFDILCIMFSIQFLACIVAIRADKVKQNWAN